MRHQAPSRRRLQMTSHVTWGFLLVLLVLSLTGCTLGPTIETRFVIVHPGQPLRILDNISATGERLDGVNGQATVNLGGWVAMPPDHWAAIVAALAQKNPAAISPPVAGPPPPAK